MSLCPLQTGSPMTCCKHLSHIRPPWPNGLPGLPEVAQHCLFADTILHCIAVWKRHRRCVSVMNMSVRGFVTLGLPGLRQSAYPPVCWKRWLNQITVFLWQLNALLTLETLSPRASIVNAWIRWFWFSLGMFSDKCCEIKSVFPYVVGIRIMSIHISCDMFLRLGLHMPYKAKISAQHRMGFILDRCIVYLGLTIPNLQKKLLLIFEIFNFKKCTLFLGTEYINIAYFFIFNSGQERGFLCSFTIFMSVYISLIWVWIKSH